MPKDKYVSITVPEEFSERIDKFNSDNNNLFPSKQRALQKAWGDYEKKYFGNGEKTVEIDGKIIGPGCPVYIIAEIGINHNGDMDTCKKLIDLAVDSGCDAVKFQKRTIKEIYSPKVLESPRSVPIKIIQAAINRGAFDSEDKRRIEGLIDKTRGSIDVVVKTKDQKNMLEFGEGNYREIDKYCKGRGVTWFASPWDIPSVDFLEKFNVPCYKVASASLTDRGLLKKIKETGKPMILSTGMSESEQIRKAVDYLGQENLILLSCVSTYPTLNEEDQNLKVIETLKRNFDCPIGYSGHESDTFPTLMAMTLGADVIERHITLGRTLYGSDQASSLEKKGLEMICKRAKQIPLYLGDGKKKILESEIPVIKSLRRVDSL